MIAEILSVGTELLLGQIVNTDAQFLSKRLSALGITVYHHDTVGDNPGRAKEAIRQALSRADLVITTGGLGPTEDDLTKEMVAETFGLEMVLHQESLDKISSYFSSMNRQMTDNNKKQAYFPAGARIMPNRKGTAPGCIVGQDGKYVAVLPGPPFELIDMYEQQLEPFLLSLSNKVIASKYLRTVGIGESSLETQLKDLFHWDTPTLALYCSPGEVQARITVMCDRNEDPEQLLLPMENEIRARLGNQVYGEGLDNSMAQTVVELLNAAGKTVTTAESCTGGMLISQLIDISGASDVVGEAHVTYSNEVKERLLGVSHDTLSEYGAVSEECAREMAEGVRRISGADYGLSTTGIAGPGGGTPEKPVGTVFVGLASNDGTEVIKLSLRGDRTRIRSMTCLQALNLLRLKLLKDHD